MSSLVSLVQWLFEDGGYIDIDFSPVGNSNF